MLKDQQSANSQDSMERMMLDQFGFQTMDELERATKDYQHFVENLPPDEENIPSLQQFLNRGSNMATDFMGDLQSAIAGKDFASKEELESFVASYMQGANQGPIDDFLGLSSEQMQRIMSGTLDDIPDLLTLATHIPAVDVREAPVMKEIQFVIAWIRANGGQIRQTSTGNFPRDLCRAFQDRFHKDGIRLPGSVMSESELWDLVTVHDFLSEAGYLYATKSTIKLTQKGESWTQHSAECYVEVFRFITDEFPWADWIRQGFGGQLVTLMQDTAAFSLFLLKELGSADIVSEDLYQAFRTAFPQVDPPSGMYHEIDFAYVLYRVLVVERYLTILGLVDFQADPSDSEQAILDPPFRLSKLFANAIRWTVARN